MLLRGAVGVNRGHFNVNIDEKGNQTNRFRDTPFKGTRS